MSGQRDAKERDRRAAAGSERIETVIIGKVRPRALTTTPPLERVRPRDLAAAGVERVPRTVGMRDGYPLLEDGRVMDVSSVLWCTGFRPDYGWVDLPGFDQGAVPVHERGIVASQPGLFVVGLFFLYAFTSALLGGVGRDAEYIANHIAARRSTGQPPLEERQLGAVG